MKSLFVYLLSLVIIIGIVFGGLTILKKEFPKQYNDLKGYVQEFKDYFKSDDKKLNTSCSSSSNSSSNTISISSNNSSNSYSSSSSQDADYKTYLSSYYEVSFNVDVFVNEEYLKTIVFMDNFTNRNDRYYVFNVNAYLPLDFYLDINNNNHLIRILELEKCDVYEVSNNGVISNIVEKTSLFLDDLNVEFVLDNSVNNLDFNSFNLIDNSGFKANLNIELVNDDLTITIIPIDFVWKD